MITYTSENVRISYLTPGPRGHYDYWVDNFSERPTTETATVKVFRGGTARPAKTYYHMALERGAIPDPSLEETLAKK